MKNILGANKKKKIGFSKKGLTLIEIVLVLALLGLVLSVIGKKVFDNFSKGKRKLTLVFLADLKSSLDQYKIDCNTYPKSLEALVANPGDCPSYDPQGYMGGKKKMPKDPFGCDVVYETDGENVKLKSLGEGCQPGGEGKATDIELEE